MKEVSQFYLYCLGYAVSATIIQYVATDKGKCAFTTLVNQ